MISAKEALQISVENKDYFLNQARKEFEDSVKRTAEIGVTSIHCRPWEIDSIKNEVESAGFSVTFIKASHPYGEDYYQVSWKEI